MSIFDHTRYKVVTDSQHLLEHSLADYGYAHPALPSTILDAEGALDYILNVLYPRIKDAVNTPADLPTGIDTPNPGDVAPTEWDQRVVNDDGDGKAALYMFFKKDGQASAQWNKIADMDFGANSVIQGLMDQTQYLFVRKFGSTDYDPVTELALTGKDAGQHIYGGDTANQNLTLHATNGDDPGVHTGYVQVNDDFRPYSDLTFDLGTATERWNNLYAGTAIIGTATMTITSDGVTGSITDTSGQISFADENLITTGNIDGAIIKASSSLVIDDTVTAITITNGSITDTSGAISFGDENLSTTGTLASGNLTVSTTLVLASGSITDTSGSISFGDENLTTTGTLGAGVATFTQLNVDDVRVDANAITITTLDTNLDISANGTGVVNFSSAVTSGNITTTGAVDITGTLDIDDITLDGTALSVVGNILTVPTLISDTDNGRDLGATASRFRTLYIGTGISDGTNSIPWSQLYSMNRNAFRDVAQTQPAQDGDALFFNAASGRWLASVPDTEIAHSGLSGLTTGDAGHTQFALLAGRVGGQALVGGTLISTTLSLKANADVSSVALSIAETAMTPGTNGTFDLGGSSNHFNNIYATGQLIGARAENTADPSLLTDTAGRLVYNTADEFLYVNDGVAFKKVGNNSHVGTYTDVQLGSAIDVSADVDDARNCVWQLCDVAASEEIMNVPIRKTATTVTVVNSVPLPAGSYKLIGIEV